MRKNVLALAVFCTLAASSYAQQTAGEQVPAPSNLSLHSRVGLRTTTYGDFPGGGLALAFSLDYRLPRARAFYADLTGLYQIQQVANASPLNLFLASGGLGLWLQADGPFAVRLGFDCGGGYWLARVTRVPPMGEVGDWVAFTSTHGGVLLQVSPPWSLGMDIGYQLVAFWNDGLTFAIGAGYHFPGRGTASSRPRQTEPASGESLKVER